MEINELAISFVKQASANRPRKQGLKPAEHSVISRVFCGWSSKLRTLFVASRVFCGYSSFV